MVFACGGNPGYARNIARRAELGSTMARSKVLAAFMSRQGGPEDDVWPSGGPAAETQPLGTTLTTDQGAESSASVESEPDAAAGKTQVTRTDADVEPGSTDEEPGNEVTMRKHPKAEPSGPPRVEDVGQEPLASAASGEQDSARPAPPAPDAEPEAIAETAGARPAGEPTAADSSGEGPVSAEALAVSVVEFVYRTKLGRAPWPSDIAYQKEFLLSGASTVEAFDALVGSVPEAQEHRSRATSAVAREKFEVHGCDFLIPAQSALAGALRDPRGYEPWVLPAFLGLCRPGMTVVDTGAKWGIYALPAARHVGATGKVFALDALPENARVVLDNALRNGIANLEVLTASVSDRFGMAAVPRHRLQDADVHVVDRNEADPSGGEWDPVSTIPLDAMRIELGRVDLMRLDAGGGEYRACMGALSLLREDRPIVFMAFRHALPNGGSGADPVSTLHVFLDLGYHFEVLHADRPAERIIATRSETIERVLAYAKDASSHIDLKLNPRAVMPR